MKSPVTRRGIVARVGFTLLGLGVIVGVFTISMTVFTNQRETANLQTTLVNDLHNSVAAVNMTSTTGQPSFVIVPASPAFSTPYTYTFAKKTPANIVRLTYDASSEYVFLSKPIRQGDTPNISGSGVEGNLNRDYQMTIISLNPRIAGSFATYNSDTNQFWSGTYNPQQFGATVLPTSDAQLVTGSGQISISAATILRSQGQLTVPGSSIGSGSTAQLRQRFAAATALTLPGKAVRFYDATGKEVRLYNNQNSLVWRAVPVLANLPALSSLSFTAATDQAVSATAQASLADGGKAVITYGSQHFTLAFQHLVFTKTAN